MNIRIIFENDDSVNINNVNTFRALAENYIPEEYSAEYAGIIRIGRVKNMEPAWQYLINNADQSVLDSFLDFINMNSLPGYKLHVMSKLNPNSNETYMN